MTLLIVLLIGVVYFLPTAIAYRRNHANFAPIFLTNIFFGWSVLGWIIALIWSFSSNVDS